MIYDILGAVKSPNVMFYPFSSLSWERGQLFNCYKYDRTSLNSHRREKSKIYI